MPDPAWRGRAAGEILAASRFGIVGLAATGVHAGVALALAMPGILPPLLANTIAFLTAFTVSFAGHHFWSFPQDSDTGKRWHARLPRFFLIALGGFAINSGALASWLTFTDWPQSAGIVVSIIVVPIVTFLGSRLWAFADTRPAHRVPKHRIPDAPDEN
ncbi:GtrA family protein [Breoghania sp.]|uniref:GtrA family protein n=1 Tax=Breoghania sp. TaxID=2065378 RepID=UPI0029CA930E|nr:GtrA family protein [Breoghania sp.]